MVLIKRSTIMLFAKTTERHALISPEGLIVTIRIHSPVQETDVCICPNNRTIGYE